MRESGPSSSLESLEASTCLIEILTCIALRNALLACRVFARELSTSRSLFTVAIFFEIGRFASCVHEPFVDRDSTLSEYSAGASFLLTLF